MLKRSRRYLFAVALALFFAAGSARATSLRGRVTWVSDGDTLWVVDSKNVLHEIRLKAIDAPEHDQRYGNQSRRNLIKLVSGKTVTVQYGKRDSYGRLVGKVIVNGRDVCLQQVRDGMAWHYKRFADEQTPGDRSLYSQAQAKARAGHVGLWRYKHPMAPWAFRHGARGPVTAGQVPPGPVVGNRKSFIYHWPGCPYYGSVSPKNRVTFANAKAAEGAGYRPARNCP